ncbi:glycosyltransferase [Thomasclavelia sp.]|uniref:glycosyltransferase n=1 Tax=Thomasclavelia sp. TaxID=3025757 RepID=UPI0025E09915|nr:glycosyltransferase [Thomasclavelia sp.]
MKIMLFLEHSFYVNNLGQIFCEKVINNDYLKRYTDVFEEVIICARKNDELKSFIDEPLENVKLLPLPNYNANQLLLKMHKIVNYIGKNIKDVKGIILRAPSSLSVVGYNVANKYNIPFISEIVINPNYLFDLSQGNIVRRYINRVGRLILVNHTKKICLESAGVSYVTENALQQQFPSNRKKYGDSSTQYETYYSSINLKEEHYSTEISNRNQDDEFIIVHTGWMVGYNKGHMEVIDVVKKLIDKGYKIKAYFIGDGPLKSELENYSNSLGVLNNICFTGKLNSFNDIQKILKKSHLFVFPSQIEGLPRAVIEAMANSLPCIASNIDGMDELLDKDFLFELENTEQIVKLIESFINNEDQRIKQGKINYNKAQKYHYDILSAKRRNFYIQFKKNVQ